MDVASWCFDAVCERIISSKLYDDILAYLNTVNVTGLNQSSAKRQIVERLVNILHHVFITVPPNNIEIQEHSSKLDSVDILQQVRDAVNDIPVTSY